MGAKLTVRGVVRNLLLAALVFLPLFLLSLTVEVKVRGASLEEGIAYHASSAGVLYFGMILQTLLGSLVHSAALLLVPGPVTRARRRLIAIALAPLVPLAFVIFRLFGDASFLFFLAFPSSAAIATLAYGLTCATQLRR